MSEDEMEEAPSHYIPEVAGDEYDYVPWGERRKVYNSLETKTETSRKNRGGNGKKAGEKRALPPMPTGDLPEPLPLPISDDEMEEDRSSSPRASLQ